MTKENEIFGSKELSKYFNGFLLAQCSLMYGLFKKKLRGRAEEIKIILGSACSTTTAITKLGEEPEYFYAETVMLARSFIEKIVNFCYLLVCEDKDFKKFLLHPLYKAYKNLSRSRKTEKEEMRIKFSGKIDLEKNPSLKRALTLFPKDRMSWTDLSIDKRVNYISKKTDINIGMFLLNTLSIYSDASEALHGSLYGCSFHTFAYDPTINHKNKEEVDVNLQKNLTLLYLQLGSMIHEVVKFLSKENNISDILNGSTKNDKNTVEIMKAAMKEQSGKESRIC